MQVVVVIMNALISIHALLAESDSQSSAKSTPEEAFLSTLSLRRATFLLVLLICPPLDFYPRSPCGERRWLRCWQLAACDISIHALLAESDKDSLIDDVSTGGFLSTLSLRRATVEKVPADVYYQAFLSTLSLRRATHHPHHEGDNQHISIHALLAESDRKGSC